MLPVEESKPTHSEMKPEALLLIPSKYYTTPIKQNRRCYQIWVSQSASENARVGF